MSYLWGEVSWGRVRSGEVSWGRVRSAEVRWGQVRSGEVRWGQVRFAVSVMVLMRSFLNPLWENLLWVSVCHSLSVCCFLLTYLNSPVPHLSSTQPSSAELNHSSIWFRKLCELFFAATLIFFRIKTIQKTLQHIFSHLDCLIVWSVRCVWGVCEVCVSVEEVCVSLLQVVKCRLNPLLSLELDLSWSCSEWSVGQPVVLTWHTHTHTHN